MATEVLGLVGRRSGHGWTLSLRRLYACGDNLHIITIMRHLICLVVVGLGLVGCTRYDFQVVQPEPLAQRITQSATRLQTANMAYIMQAYENRLVVQIHNTSTMPVMLLGEKSFVVDPVGGSHPLRSLTIAPDSYAKLILPPLRPRFEDHRWHFGVGVGTQIGAAQAVEPIYLDMYADTDAYYWDWDGTTVIRLRLTYRRADATEVSDDFTIGKVEAK